MKYISIVSGKIVEGFSFIPSIDLNWMTLTDKR